MASNRLIGSLCLYPSLGNTVVVLTIELGEEDYGEQLVLARAAGAAA